MRRALCALLFTVSFPLIAFERQPNADYHVRRERFAAKLDGQAVALLFANSEAEGQNALGAFRQNDDFYYLTGWNEPGAAVLIAPANDKRVYTEILFLPAHNATQERWTGPKLGAENAEAPRATGFDHVETLDKMRDRLVALLPGQTAVIYTNTEHDAPLEWLKRANSFPNYTSYRDATAISGELRVTKDTGEIALIRKATDATVEAHKAAMRSARPGMTENELSAIMQYEFQRRGCETPAYAPIVGSGFNSTVLHYSQNSGTMQNGDLVVLDVGGEYSRYATDVTRTLPVNGHFTPRQREIYDIVLGAQQAAIDGFKAGASSMGRTGANSLYKIAYEYINTHGKDAHGEPLGQYFIHGLSHYVGLNVHDSGDRDAPLGPGAVFTIEPGIYIPEEKLGVRIEDTFLVGADGKLICLSCGVAKKAAEVEALMASRAAISR
jgi:Xaa-Pro aminopeptidase